MEGIIIILFVIFSLIAIPISVKLFYWFFDIKTYDKKDKQKKK